MTDLELAIVRFDENGNEPYADLIYDALKKRLPTKTVMIGTAEYCPSCRYEIDDFYLCCSNCGQVLRG